MLDAVTKYLLAANEDRDVRAIVITGTGAFFCAGLDLRGGDIGSGLSNSAGPANLDLRNTPPTVLHAVDKPTICALNGSAAGYGMDLALGCDIRIMADTAKTGRRIHRARCVAGIGRHVDPAASARLVESRRTDLHGPHADRR